MMGMKERAFAPLTHMSLEELDPQDHFYRHLERKVDLSFVRTFVQKTYANTGRPSIDPIVFFKLQLVMFFESIRSERQLVRQAADRLSIRWYLGYDLDEPLPDHSSLSRIRARYGLDVFRSFFDAIVEQCQQAKLIWGKELYLDSTQVNANADMDSLVTRFAVEAREAIQTHLAALFAEANPQQEPQEAAGEEALASPEPTPLPVVLSELEREELEAELSTKNNWIREEGRQQREVHGLYQRRSDQRVSTTDPDATPMRLKSGGLHLGYHTHYVVDGGKRRIILAALVIPAEVMDNQPMLDLLWHVRFRWHLIPTCVLRDASKMGEVGHRTEALRIGFQLIESVTDLVDDLIERGKSQIRQVFFAHFFPHMFHRIELWTVSRLSNQSDICRDLEIFGLMPSSLIDLHHHKVLRISGGHMLQKHIHHVGIGRGQNERRHFAFRWRHSRIDVGVFAHDLMWRLRPHSRRSPGTSRDAHATEAAFIFGHL